MVTITPPPSNRGTPARLDAPQEASMEVDSVPQSPITGPGSATSAPGTDIPSPAKGSDTEDDDGPVASNNPVAPGEDSAGPVINDLLTTGWPSKSRKSRDMFDAHIVDRWNAEFGDLFDPSDAAP
ncbi:hypothetical protein CspHIS471_0204370 [Cutaneotrichosporon sp. HIS471]|nr:hypothetical protein CspHIS471_0204370 [Cutaneotrichosporon sp. HIS471]